MIKRIAPCSNAWRKQLSLCIVFLSVLFSVRVFGECILTIRNGGADFDEAYRGLTDELSGDFRMADIVVDRNTDVPVVKDAMQRYKPKLVVLMDNSSIRLYRGYVSGCKPDEPVIPSVSLMGVMVKHAVGDLKNAVGISYEIPIVTSAVGLRSVIGVPIKRIGVVHRKFHNEFIDENREFCRRESIELLSSVLPNKCPRLKRMLKNSLKQLEKKGIDALWIPNDNVLLTPAVIKAVWLPVLGRMKVPVMVGVKVLVNPKLNMGTFAVLPDHVALGGQAAEMVFELQDNDWVVEGTTIDPPLAVYKILNVRQARKLFKVTTDKLNTIDKKLE